MRTHHIVHPRQTEQDALNEFASKLAHPPERHVAQVRLPPPGGHHEVKLVSPLTGPSNRHQIDTVRKRSRDLYSVASGEVDEPETPPPAASPTEPRPPITRRSPDDLEVDSNNIPEEEVDDDDNFPL